MRITKRQLRRIIKEEIGRLDRADEPPGGWTTTKDPGGRKRPLRKTVPVGEEDPEDYDEEDLLAMQHGRLPEGSPLQEQGGWDVETGSPLLDFAQAWAGLGGAVQEQVVAVLAAWERGGHEPDWSDTVYEQNPNAIDMAVQRLGPVLRDLGEHGEYVWDALEEAQLVFSKG